MRFSLSKKNHYIFDDFFRLNARSMKSAMLHITSANCNKLKLAEH